MQKRTTAAIAIAAILVVGGAGMGIASALSPGTSPAVSSSFSNLSNNGISSAVTGQTVKLTVSTTPANTADSAATFWLAWNGPEYSYQSHTNQSSTCLPVTTLPTEAIGSTPVNTVNTGGGTVGIYPSKWAGAQTAGNLVLSVFGNAGATVDNYGQPAGSTVVMQCNYTAITTSANNDTFTFVANGTPTSTQSISTLVVDTQPGTNDGANATTVSSLAMTAPAGAPGAPGSPGATGPAGAPAPAGNGGYYMVAGDGGVFTFGGAKFYGSMGGQHLNFPIVGMSVTPGDGGYILYASDGGVFCFGNAVFAGSEGGTHLASPVVGGAAS